VLDLAGNVEEWTSSKLSTDGGAGRLFRGGSFSRDEPENVATSARTAYHADLDTPVIGFRCAKAL
jgi:formylglycine-generating enzyme required for sulfatase activity